MDKIEDGLREMNGKIIVSGDLHAYTIEWGEPILSSKGNRVMEIAARLNLHVVDAKRVTTCRTEERRQMIVVIWLASEDSIAVVVNFCVIEDYTGSDY